MTEDGKPTDTEITQEGAVEIQDEQLDAASGGASDYLLNTTGLKSDARILGAASVKFGDGSVRGIKYVPGGKP